jgi:two-component system sensor histidine kinase KdpD
MAAVSGTPSSNNLVLVLVEDHPKAILLLRTARKRAQERNGKWRAVFVETPLQHKHADDDSQERILRLLTMAEQMGGESEHLEVASTKDGLELLCAREEPRLSLVIIGNAGKNGAFSRFKMVPWIHTVHTISQRTQVEIVPLSGPLYQQSFLEKIHWRSIRPRYLGYALLSVAGAAICASILERTLPPALFRINDYNIASLFMISCAFVAGKYGLLPGLVAAITGFLTLNYYFTVPYHALKIFTVTDTLNMVLFLSAALLIALFTSQTRGYAEKATKRELGTQLLFTLYRIASTSSSRKQAIEKLQRRLERMLDIDVAFFMPPVLNPERIELAAPENIELGEADRRALDTCWRDTKTTGIASSYDQGTSWRFEPMVSSGGEIGIIAVRPRKKMRMDAWFGRLLTAIADQTANVLEHIELERSMESTRIREEREKLRSMLLSSVSHDLKTPLSGIIGALSVHQSLGDRLTLEKRNDLIDSSLEEAQRLDSFITNILDMTKLESGNIKFKQEWYSAQSMIDSVRKRLAHRLKRRKLMVHPIPSDLEVFMDVVMTEQVLQNILDNACKYTPEGSTIEIACTVDPAKGFICSVRDHGKGLPPEKIDQAFDKYARLQKQDSQVAGTGLGLAIAKSVIDAQKGWITAGNHPEGGAMFAFCLPQWRCLPMTVAEEKKHAVYE